MTVAPDQLYQFIVEVTPEDGTSYQWQVKESASASWRDFSEKKTSLKKMLWFTVTEAMHGWQFRCRVTNGGETVYSTPFTVSITGKGAVTPARSVDNLLQGNPVTLLKMDVEGSEREALWGASRSIARYSPKLMISLYHRNEDVFELPLLVRRINPRYRLYIRHLPYIPAWETNLYAVCDETGSTIAE